MTLIFQLLANGIVNGVLYALLAVGFGLVWRCLRIFHVAFAGLYLVCGYSYYVFVNWIHLSVYTSAVLTLLVAAVIGLLTEICFYRPFYRKNASFGSVLIASLGVYIVLVNLISIFFGNELRTVDRELINSWNFGRIVFTKLQLIELITATMVISLFGIIACRFRVFKAVWAMGDQPDLIPVLGLPIFRLRSIVLIFSTCMAAVPACLITHDVGIAPHIGMSTVLIAAVAVLVGGFNSYSGWVCGAIILALLQSFVVWEFSARWMDLVTFAILLMTLIFRPHGVLAEQSRLEESA